MLLPGHLAAHGDEDGEEGGGHRDGTGGDGQDAHVRDMTVASR